MKLKKTDTVRSIDRVYMVITTEDGKQELVKVMMAGMRAFTTPVSSGLIDTLESLEYSEDI